MLERLEGNKDVKSTLGKNSLNDFKKLLKHQFQKSED